MTWLRYPANTWGVEAKPVSAAEMVDLVRGNCDHLMRNSPSGCAWFWVNGAPTSAVTTFVDASTLWRAPLGIVRSALDRQLRVLKMRVHAYVSAGSATLRFCMSSSFRVVASPAGDGDSAITSAAGAVTSTSATAPDEITLRMVMGLQAMQLSSYGEGDDNRARPLYRATYLSLQGTVNNVANTLTVQSVNIEEEDAP